MSKMGLALIAAGIVTMLAAPAAAVTNSKGQLVYNFTYSSNQNTTARDAQDSAQPINSEAGSVGAGGSGMSHYGGSLNDKGTLTVDLLGRQPDGGIIVNVSEAGENIRRAPPATCVVYGNTNVICDPNKTVYTEEYTLLRFLGGNFVDPTSLDAQRHWQIVQNGGTLNVKADYTINSNSDGKMQISETRSVRDRSGGSMTTDVQSKIGYDFNRSVPTSVDEYVTQRHDNGVAGTSTTIYQTTLNLVSDTVGT